MLLVFIVNNFFFSYKKSVYVKKTVNDTVYTRGVQTY
jgi:hypothetical protein